MSGQGHLRHQRLHFNPVVVYALRMIPFRLSAHASRSIALTREKCLGRLVATLTSHLVHLESLLDLDAEAQICTDIV